MIPSYCFQYCKGLERVVFGENVFQVNGYAFRGCNNLKTLVFHRTTPPSIVSTAFSGTTLERVEVPASALEQYRTTFSEWADIMVGIEGE